MSWDKVDIVHFLSEVNFYRSYLEICTPTTGSQFWKIDKTRYDICHRLMYRCSESFDDQLAITFRAATLDTSQCISEIHERKLRYDIILVDSFHLYETSYRDLTDAINLVSDSGTVVVHDCMPPSEEFVSSEFSQGPWCGVSFMAFVNFVNARGLRYLTVDTDCGCGLVQKTDELWKDESSPLLRSFNDLSHDPKAAYRFLIANKGPLLRLVSLDDFKRSNARARA